MEPSETYEEAGRCARAAIRKMAELRIIFYPRNFTIWYTYFSGKYPDLSDALKKFLKKDGYFTEDRNTLIYQKFFGFDQLGKTIRKVTAETTKVLGEAHKHVKIMCSESEAARQRLDASCAQLEKAGKSDAIKELVQEILATVRSLEEATGNIEKRLSEDFKKISELHRSIEESQRESMTDALTGIANRKLFDACLRLAAEDHRKSAALSVILVDVDNLGDYNKVHGFNAGDEVLRAISRILSENVKGRDMPARYGDDEFAVLAANTLLFDAAKLARNIREVVWNDGRAMDIEAVHESTHPITLSIGVAQYEPGESLNRFIGRSKQALAAAKSNGRNQMVSVEKTHHGVMLLDEDHMVINPRI